MSYTLLVTHPDDELVNMANFLFLGNSYLILVTQNKRVKQFKKLCKTLQKEYTMLPFQDGYLLSYDRDLVLKEIENSIPEDSTLVVPSMYDTHPEHLLVSAIGTRIAYATNKDLIYSTCKKTESTEAKPSMKLELLNEFYPEVYKELMGNYLIDNTETYTQF